jgi:hypothetical protein
LITNDEFAVLSKWRDFSPKQKIGSAFPPTEVEQRLIDAGFMERITRPDASNPKVYVVVGYDVTVAGEEALEQH